MNSNRYRIVFNRARGQLMAVAETAATNAGGPGQHTSRGKTHRRTPLPHGVHLRATAMASWLMSASRVGLFGLTFLWLSPSTHAQIVADPTAPVNQRPTIIQDSSGRPQVNIQTPSTGGVSRNTYSQFDVQAKGAVLNNDRATNPFLAAAAAKVILNEVNSTNPSLLNGPITVTGTRAQVIVANPAGIKVDGGSFINASRATLTTGTAVMKNGTLSGFDVRQGAIEINGKGLSVLNVPYTDILARAAKLTGAIQAGVGDEIAVTTGTQTVDYTTGLLTANAGTGAKPILAIDTSALGGMYAGKITLLATEAGVGVRNAGKLQSYANATSQLIITADGRLENTGTMSSAVTSVGTISGDIINSGVLKGSKVVIASAGADLRLSGKGLEQDSTTPSSVMLHAGRDILASTARIISLSSVTSANGEVARGQISMSAGRHIDLSGGAVEANAALRLTGSGKVTAKDASLSSSTSSAVLLAEQGINLNNTNISGRRVQVETGAAFKETRAGIDISGGKLKATEQINLTATGDITIADLGKDAIASKGVLHVQAGGTALIRSSVAVGNGRHLDAATDATIKGESVFLGGVNVGAARDLTFESTRFNVFASGMAKGGTPAFEAAQLSAGQSLKIYAPAATQLAGIEATAKHVSIAAGTEMSLSYWDGTVGGTRQSQISRITSGGDVFLMSLGAGKSLSVDGTVVKAAGNVAALSSGALALNATPQGAGVQIKGANVSLQGTGLKVAQGNIEATAGHIEMAATQGNSTLGAATGGKLTIKASGNVSMHAKGASEMKHLEAQAGGSMSATSATSTLSSQDTQMKASDALSLASKGSQTHTNGSYFAGGASLYNEIGTLNLKETRVETNGNSTTIAAQFDGKLSLESGGAIAVDSSSYLSAGTDLSLIAGSGNLTLLDGGGDYAAAGLLLSYGTQVQHEGGLNLMARNGDVAIVHNDYSTTLRPLSTDRAYSHGLSITPLGIPQPKDIKYKLIGNNVNLRGATLSSRWFDHIASASIVATTGNVNIDAAMRTETGDRIINNRWLMTGIKTLGDIDIRAANDIVVDSLNASAQGKVSMISGRNLIVAGKVNRTQTDERAGGGWYRDEESVEKTSISGAAGITLSAAGGSLNASGAVLQSQGDMLLQAQDDLSLKTAFTQRWMERTHTTSDRKIWGTTTTTTRYYNNSYIDTTPVALQGRDIRLEAGRDVLTEATQFTASRDFRLDAGGKALYHSARSLADISERSEKTRSFSGILGTPLGAVLGKNITRSKSRSTDQTLTEFGALIQAQNDILSTSGDDQVLQGTRLVYGGAATFGFGPNAKTGAKIILEGVKQTVAKARTTESDYVVWQRQMGSGSTIETLTMPSFNGPTKPVFNGPVLAQLPEGDFKAQIKNLSTQPGLSYLNDLGKRKDVQWQPVKLAYDKWEYKQEGLTPAGAALIAVAVTFATGGVDGGMGASLVGATTTAGSAMANAAFASLASQAAITFVNNKGDITKTLKDMGKSETIKAAVAAAITAGVLDKIGALDSIKALKQPSATFTDKLTLNLVNAGGRALTNTAINGGSLADVFKSAIIGAVVDTAHGAVASEIKVLEADYIAHKLAHAVAGCVAGAAAQGTCKDGAAGAAIGEIVAGFVKPANGMYYTEAEKSKVLGLSKIVAGAVSAYNGGNAQTAITTAETAVSNNALFVPPLVYWLATAAGAYVTGAGGGNPVAGLQAIGQGSDPLSKAITNGTQAAVTLSMQTFPKETTATLTLLSSVGEKVDATISYVDAATGKVVSTSWNNLNPGTRDALIGAGKVTSVVLSPVGVGQVKSLITKMPKAVARKLDVAAEHALVKSGGVVDKTGLPVLDMKQLSNQQKGLAGELFGPSTVKQIVPDGLKLARIPGIGETGIDDLYKVSRADVDYVVIEYKFVGDYDKKGSSQLGNTSDGVQGSLGWVNGGDRLEKALGSRAQADAVANAAKLGRVESWVITTRPNGSTELEVLDAVGKVKTVDKSKIQLPKLNVAGAKP